MLQSLEKNGVGNKGSQMTVASQGAGIPRGCPLGCLQISASERASWLATERRANFYGAPAQFLITRPGDLHADITTETERERERDRHRERERQT